MKINTTPTTVSGAADSSKPRASGAPPRAQVASSAEQVEISPLSSRLQEIAAATTAEASASMDTKRVAEIKQAIAEGRFKVDPERIADGLLDSVRQMIKKDRAPT